MRFTDTQMRAMLAALVATGGPFDPVTTFVGIAADVAAVEPPGATAMADVVPATGLAATRVEVTAWSPPHQLLDGRWAVDGPQCEFTVADATQAQVVEQWFYASAAVAGVLKGWGPLPNAVNLADQFRSVSIIPRLTIDPQGQWDATVVYNG